MKNNTPMSATAAAWALMAAVAAFGPAAHAFEDRDAGLYVEGGPSLHGGGNTTALGIGAILPWSPRHMMEEGALSFYWDLFLSQWSAPVASLAGGHRNYAQIGGIATWRYRFGRGESRWFTEAGIGGSVMNRVYHSASRDFSTTFQFTEVLGAGYSFGARGQHEVSLRLQHFSNGGIKKPNPGENFVRLRYAYRF